MPLAAGPDGESAAAELLSPSSGGRRNQTPAVCWASQEMESFHSSHSLVCASVQGMRESIGSKDTFYFWLCNVHRDQRWNLTFRAEVFSEEDVEMSGTFSAKSHCYCELSLLGAKLRWWVGFWSPSSELVGNCQHWLFEHYITSKLCTWHHLTVYYVQHSHLYVFIDRWHTNLSAAVGLRH